MWRLWMLVLVGPVWAEGDLGEEDAGYLEQRLDDLGGLDAAAVRWRVRGAEAAWERWQLYQRVEVAPVSGQAFFGLTERDPGESGWSDFRTFYYAVQRRRSEWVVGDLRPGTGAGLVFGRNRRGSIAPRMPAGDSRRLGYRSSGENHALRGVAWRYEGRVWSGMLIGGWARRDGRLDEQGQVRSLPESGYHVTATEVAGRDLLGIRAGGGRLHWRGEHWQWGTTLLALDFSHYIDLRRNGRTPWGFVGDEQRMGAVDGRVDWDWGRAALESGWRWDGALGDSWGTARAAWGSAAEDAGPLLRAGISQLLWRGSGDFGHAKRTGWRRRSQWAWLAWLRGCVSPARAFLLHTVAGHVCYLGRRVTAAVGPPLGYARAVAETPAAALGGRAGGARAQSQMAFGFGAGGLALAQ